jgi:hypothetical protein
MAAKEDEHGVVGEIVQWRGNTQGSIEHSPRAET